VDELWVLFIIIMIVASFIEKAAKAGKKGPGQAPPRRAPGRWPGAELPPPRSREPGAPRRPEEVRAARDVVVLPDPAASEGSAADMIAEDFWRELTGQPPIVRPAPAQVPAQPEGADSWDTEAVRQVEAPPPERMVERTSESWDYRRPEVVHEPPVIVSLETPLQSPTVRHTAYHRRVDALPPPASTSPERTRSPLQKRLRSEVGAREGVILAEIYGPPRGLEEYTPER